MSAKCNLYLDDVLVAKNGGRNPDYREEDGQRVMQQSEITVRVELGRGERRDHGVDLRFVARLREHQRRLPHLIRPYDLRRHRMSDLRKFLARAESRAGAPGGNVAGAPMLCRTGTGFAFRWRKRSSSARGHLQAVVARFADCLSDLQGIEAQKPPIEQNTSSSSPADPRIMCC